jgi:hypothetical protein
MRLRAVEGLTQLQRLISVGRGLNPICQDYFFLPAFAVDTAGFFWLLAFFALC